MQVVILHTVEVIHITLKSIKKGRRVKTKGQLREAIRVTAKITLIRLLLKIQKVQMMRTLYQLILMFL